MLLPPLFETVMSWSIPKMVQKTTKVFIYSLIRRYPPQNEHISISKTGVFQKFTRCPGRNSSRGHDPRNSFHFPANNRLYGHWIRLLFVVSNSDRDCYAVS